MWNSIRYGSRGWETIELSTLFEVSAGPNGLQRAVTNLCQQAAEAVRSGKQILILSDRVGAAGSEELSLEKSYIPPMLAIGAVHHHLIRQGLRMKASLIADTAQCWSTHHFACLIGYGASAVCPYLALETVRQWWADSRTQNLMERGKLKFVALAAAQANYRQSDRRWLAQNPVQNGDLAAVELQWGADF